MTGPQMPGQFLCRNRVKLAISVGMRICWRSSPCHDLNIPSPPTISERLPRVSPSDMSLPPSLLLSRLIIIFGTRLSGG